MLAVEVRNRGRAATVIERVYVRLPNGMEWSHPNPPVGPGINVRLDAESANKWYFEVAPVQAVIQSTGTQARVRGVVTLGSGRKVESKEAAL